MSSTEAVAGEDLRGIKSPPGEKEEEEDSIRVREYRWDGAVVRVEERRGKGGGRRGERSTPLESIRHLPTAIDTQNTEKKESFLSSLQFSQADRVKILSKSGSKWTGNSPQKSISFGSPPTLSASCSPPRPCLPPLLLRLLSRTSACSPRSLLLPPSTTFSFLPLASPPSSPLPLLLPQPSSTISLSSGTPRPSRSEMKSPRSTGWEAG